ncbi:MAG TPA: GNAT family N-acetyltransferase, partial [Acidimicrobiia bacterium]
MDLELRPIVDDEFPAFNRAVATAFGVIPTEEELESWQGSLAAERTLAGFDEGRIVATAGAYTFRLTVPGGAQVPTAGITVVGVHPTHRRRGLLARMMDEQLRDVASRGEHLAVLTASESSIYGRFGYGLATFSTWWQLATAHAGLADSPTSGGRIRLADRDTGPAIAQAVFEAARADRVGEVTRDPRYWERVYREQRGPASPDSDGKPFFTAVHEDAGGRPDAFARYRIIDDWAHGQP